MKRFCAALLATALTIPASPALAGREDGTLRVGTWNTYLISNVFRCLAAPYDVPAVVDCMTKSTSLSGWLSPDQTIKRANEVADAIEKLGDKVDVIALNEVWDETAKNQLVKRLSKEFPNYISRVDAGHVLPVPATLEKMGLSAVLPSWEGEDSGLMLFARRDVEFLPMGRATPVPRGGIQGTIKQVRAQTYAEGSGIDALAAKGMAAVHVQLKVGPSVSRAYIVFSHTQADADQASARDSQFKQMRNFILRNVIDPKRNLDNELARVLVVGDLNVLGQSALLPIPAGSKFDEEWVKRFTSPFPGLTFADSWALENSEKYIGPTYPRAKPEDGDRLDYLLKARGTRSAGFCAQHSRVLLNTAPSDHSALVTDLNQVFPFCRPRFAAKPSLTGNFQPVVGTDPDPIRIAFNAPQTFDVSLRDAASPSTAISATKSFDAANGWTLTLPVPGLRNMVVRVARNADKATPRTVSASWTSNLQVDQITSLECADETNGFLGSEAGEDEISLSMKYDGIKTETLKSTYISFDCDNWHDEKAQFGQTLRTFGNVSARINEWDDGSPNDHSNALDIPLLPVDTLKDDGDQLVYSFEGGTYYLHYQRRRASSGLPPLQ